jgi:hypothetical protein
MRIMHAHAKRRRDSYATPACAVEALLRVENLPRRLWEPACGAGAIIDVLRAYGHAVIGSDIGDDGRSDCFWHRNFLYETKAPDGCECIVTNPPYCLATEFVTHALELCPLVVMLLRLTFLESMRRSHILDGGKLARVHVFARRLPMAHREGWTGPRASSSVAYAWFAWDANHSGAAIVNRISWQP